MQLSDLQQLVRRLKENSDMQVETTTLGKFLGASGARIAFTLGKEVLSRPVIVSTRDENIQIIDLKSGFVISLSSSEDIIPKLLQTFSGEAVEKPKAVSSVRKTEMEYKKIIKKVPEGPLGIKLSQFRDVMMNPGSLEDRMALIEKTIELLEMHKTEADGRPERIVKAQDKLRKMLSHVRSKRLAPGQIPSVYEIAIWSWVN